MLFGLLQKGGFAVGEMKIVTTRVPSLDAQGRRGSVECQNVIVWRHGEYACNGHQYHYDHSHVTEKAGGVLLVQATGEELRLCAPSPTDD